MGSWTLRLLGQCELLAPNGKPVTLPTRKSLAMLAFLARQNDLRARRQRLAALLWEDADNEQARLHLRKALWHVRTQAAVAAGESPIPIEAEGEWIGLRAGELRTDADTFLAAVAGAGDDVDALEGACRLYTSDLLADFSVRNAPAFDDWVQVERQRLRETAIGAMRKLVDLLLVRPERSEAAMQAALRLLAVDPLQEHAHRVLMRLHVRQGRPAAALSHFHLLKETLRRELAVDPEPATQELFREIGQGRRMQERRRERAIWEAPPESADELGSTSPPAPRPASLRFRPSIVAGMCAAALALLAVWLFWGRGEASPPRVERVFPISSELVMTGRPALSPDGSRLVFTARPVDSSNVDLFMMTLGDPQAVRLTRDPAIDDNAAWSPDGRSVAFVRTAARGDAPCRILVMMVPAAGERVLGGCRTSPSTHLEWNGAEEILFSDQPDSDSPHRIYGLSLASGRVRSLTAPPADSFGDRNPRLSRDGRELAFLRDSADRSTDLFLKDIESGAVRGLTSEGGTLSGLAWGEGDAGLLYSSDRSGDVGLWWIARTGGQPQRVSAGVVDYRLISHARDRPLLVLETVRDRSELRVLSPDGRTAIGLPGAAADAKDTFPDVTTDGAIVFVSTRSGQEQLWIAEPGRPTRRVTQLENWRLSDPRWSPDGRHIAFVASRGDRTDLYLMRRDGGAPIRLTDDAAEDSAPAWAADGRHLYFGSRRGGVSRIWRLAPFRRDSAPSPVSPAGPGDLRIDPLGRWIYYLYPGRAGIWRRALSSNGERLVGPEQRVASDFAARDWRNWAVSAHAVYYAVRQRGIGAGRIMRVDVASGRTQDVADATDVHRQSTFSPAPGGRMIVPIRTVEIDLFGMELSR